MYLERISISNLRSFEKTSLELQFPGRGVPKQSGTLECPNVNLILGNNGAGKSTLLKAVALASLGPIAEKFPAYRLVRDVRNLSARKNSARRKRAPTVLEPATIDAEYELTWQDLGKKKPVPQRASLHTRVSIERRGDEEFVRPDSRDVNRWAGIFDHKSPAFLTVGYGATRRVETGVSALTPQARLQQMPLRQQRVQSLFYEHYALVPLSQWLPRLRNNKGRFIQIVHRLNEVLPDGYEFAGELDPTGESLFRQGRALVPFPALSDGCRAFVGWVADLLYHISMGCPSGVKLVDNCGLVLVDEIDLHLHPEWQRVVIPRLSKTFPNLQFIFTSHSPIVVGTLRRENLWVCEPERRTGASQATQKPIGVHGLNADQILLTGYFGLKTTRARAKERQLDRIAAAVERREPEKAKEFLRALVTAYEDESEPEKMHG